VEYESVVVVVAEVSAELLEVFVPPELELEVLDVPDVLLDELVSVELVAEPSSVVDSSGVSRNTTERMSVSIRRNNARAT
jgi:hypothetical protein